MKEFIMDELQRIEVINAIKDISELAIPYTQAVKAYYDGLIVAGFTPEQALTLTSIHGFMPPQQQAKEE